MSLISYTRGQTSVIVRIKILDSSVTTGAGLTGLTFSSTGLIIGTIASNEATTTAYTAAGSTIETVATLGTYATPTATKCRFREVDATSHPGVYELQFVDTRFAVANSRHLLISISGATNAAQTDALIPLTDFNPYDAVRGGLTALPTEAAEAVGGLFTRGTGAGQINQDANGRIDAHLNDGAHGGTAAVLTLERLIAVSTTTNEPAVKLTGNGVGAGLQATGGSAGDGFKGVGLGGGDGFNGVGGTSGHGMYLQGGTNNGDGLHCEGVADGDGIRAESQVSGTGNGMTLVSGGGINGRGLFISARSSNGNGVRISGSGTEAGIYVEAGDTGHVFELVGGATSGDIFNTTVTSGTHFSDGMIDEINAECDIALGDYDSPTKAEMDAGFAALNDVSTADLDTALATYDGPTKAEMDAGFAALNDISTADLDTALATYDGPTKAEMDAGFAGLNDLSTADIDARLLAYDAPTKAELDAGFAALNDVSTADLDTALATYDGPTKAEMDAGFAALNDVSTADLDAALTTYDAPTKAELDAGFAALNDVSTADLDTALATYDAPTKAELDSAFTEIKGATWSASTDTLEEISNNLGAGGDALESKQDTIIADIAAAAADITSVKGKTDQMVFTTANQLDSRVMSMATNSLTADAAAADFIGASEIAASASQEIADLIAADWISADASPLAIVAALKADPQWSNLVTMQAAITALNNLSTADIDARLAAYDAPTKAELDAAFATVDGDLSAVTAHLVGIKGSGWAAGASLEQIKSDTAQVAAVASDVTTAKNAAVSVDTKLTSGRVAKLDLALSTFNPTTTAVHLADADGLTEVQVREATLAHISGLMTVTDNDNGTRTVTFLSQGGDPTHRVTYNRATGVRTAVEIPVVS
jgi:hypothetical protein